MVRCQDSKRCSLCQKPHASDVPPGLGVPTKIDVPTTTTCAAETRCTDSRTCATEQQKRARLQAWACCGDFPQRLCTFGRTAFSSCCVVAPVATEAPLAGHRRGVASYSTSVRVGSCVPRWERLAGDRTGWEEVWSRGEAARKQLQDSSETGVPHDRPVDRATRAAPWQRRMFQ